MKNCFEMEININPRKPFLLFMLCTVLSLLTGCGQRHNTEINVTAFESQQNSDAGLTDSSPQQNAESTSVYQQAALYIQEGFRKYNVKGSYHAYFSEPEPIGADGYTCEVLLVGETGSWEEKIFYTMDESGWYTFQGEYEPVMTGDEFYVMDQTNDYCTNLMENCVYETQFAMDTDLQTPVRYFSENGPTLSDGAQIGFFNDNWEQYTDLHYYVEPYLYSYQDERLDTDIIIEYPQVSMENEELETTVNAQLREAFFYGYYPDETLTPEKKMYVFINRMYKVTRNDADYLSFRISEYNSFRGANHPNEWETGITIDMHTGQIIRLQDIVEENYNIIDLLDTNAFTCLWEWSDTTEEAWLKSVRESYENYGETLDDYNNYFYLTEDSLGLITQVSRYYTCIEADLDSLEGLVSLP